MESALERMRQDGASIKQLKSYRATGFGAIIRYCERNGFCNNVETILGTIVDEFINKVRIEYKQGKISKWKWQQVRRGGELLKHFCITATLDLPPCVKWEALHNPLHRAPTQEELCDSDNIFSLIWRTKNEMVKFNLTPKSIKNYLYEGFDRILHGHIKNNVTRYSQELTAQMVNKARGDYKSGKTYRSVYQNMRRTAALIDEFYKTGALTWHHLPAYDSRKLHDGFAKLLSEFSEDAERTGILKSSSIAQVRNLTRRFMFELTDAGIYSFDDVTPRIISDRVTSFARNYAGGMNCMLFSVRTFLQFLHADGITKEDLSAAVPEIAASRKYIREGFSNEEVHKLLTQTDSSTSIGKRDYAIMMLASQTGLRACDIANLKRQDIHWRTNEIRISQVKTGRALSLRLPVESGNAIAEYILNARHNCGIENIFLCKDRPFRPIGNRSMSGIVSRNMHKAGIANSSVKRRGFHSFRRTFGKRLLEAETSLDMLNELLGHSRMDSSKPYVAIDEGGLKKCALNLVTIGKERDVA